MTDLGLHCAVIDVSPSYHVDKSALDAHGVGCQRRFGGKRHRFEVALSFRLKSVFGRSRILIL